MKAPCTLKPQHYQHFIDDGLQPHEITQVMLWGVRSVSRAEAKELLGYTPPSGGIWFPFSDSWGQLRPDSRRYADGRESPKYCSPKGPTGPQAVWLPPGAGLAELVAATEGWKDAALATMRGGRPVAAIAGVSHVLKALPEGAGVPLLFDSDAWVNSHVMGHLIKGGVWLNAPVAIIPGPPAEKWGATEFFTKGGHSADGFQAMLAAGLSPLELLRAWMDRLSAAPLELPKHCDDVAALYRKVGSLAKVAGVGRKDVRRWQSAHLKAWRAAYEAQLRAEQVLSLKDAPIGEFEPLALPTGRRLIALNGQKGTAKTSKALRGLIQAARAAGLSVLYYVPTQMLSREAAGKLGLDCHLDKEKAAQSSYVMACGESAHLFRDRRWDLVIVDEVNEVLPRNWAGTLGQHPRAARAALAGQIAAARVVAIAQDGLYRPVLNAVQRIGRFSADQVSIISRRRPQSAGTIQLYHGDSGYYGWANTLLGTAATGAKVAIPSGSENEASLLQRWLRQRCPDGIHKRLSGKSKSFGGDRQAFAHGPDGWIAQNQPSTLAYTPVFNSGVSIEQPYFAHQFEYVASLETATAASQRGERVRAAIGDIPRHVFVQKRGLPSLPPLEIFTADYWRAVLTAEATLDKPNLKALGMGDIAAQLDSDTCPLDAFPELAECLAIQAREIHFKEECLRAEWASNGWAVVTGTAADADTAAALAGERGAIREGMLQSKARSLAWAPDTTKAARRCPKALAAFKGKAEAEGPVTAVKYSRWGIEAKLGNLPLMDAPEFWAAFYLDSVGEIGAAQLNALLRLQFNQPELWAAMQRNAALRVIGGHAVRDAAAMQAASSQRYGLPELPTVPELVASPRLLTTAQILGQCPGIKAVMAGELHQWDKSHPQVKAAKRWAISNAEKLAALSQHGQRWHGLQFTPKTPAVAAFHKLLKMVGIHAQKAGQCDRVWQYRLQIAADIQARIDAAIEQGTNTARLLRERYRAEHREAVISGALATAAHAHHSVAQDWAALEAFTREHFTPCTQLQKEGSNTSESLCSPQTPPPELPPDTWAELREMVSYARKAPGDVMAALRELVIAQWGAAIWGAVLAT